MAALCSSSTRILSILMTDHPLALASGFSIEELVVERVLGQGAFGITYLVKDRSLGVRYALKEYFPKSLATRSAQGRIMSSSEGDRAAFEIGLDRFVSEGKLVAPLDHQNVVRVIRLIRANNTAYLQMPYYRGGALSDLLGQWGPLTEGEVLAIVYPLLDALRYIHSHNIIHRDTKPSNIYLKNDGNPLLLDFGAARAVDMADARSHTAIGSDGYAALEQSSTRARLGPWTDIYGMAATFYKIMTAEVPVPSPDRADETYHGHDDPLRSLATIDDLPYSMRLRRAIDVGLRIRATERPQSVDEWSKHFRGERRTHSTSSPMVPAQTPQLDAPAQAADATLPEVVKEHRPWGLYAALLLFGVGLTTTAAYFALTSGDDADESAIASTTEDGGRAADSESDVATDEAAWQQAYSVDTPESYAEYLREFPTGSGAEMARRQLADFEAEAWQALQASQSVQEHNDYLAVFDESANAPAVRRRLQRLGQEAEARRQAVEAQKAADLAGWNAARNQGTNDAMDAYLANFPKGAYRADARELRRRIKLEEDDRRAFVLAERRGTRDGYQRYIDAFPQGFHIADALQALDDLTFKHGKVFADCQGCPTMIVLGSGSFTQGAAPDDPMGKSSEKPEHRVRIEKMFAMGVYEVTFAQWDRCWQAGSCPPAEDPGWGRNRRPVINVDWDGANQFAQWLSDHTGQVYRLPSESEWEYAARAGTDWYWIGREDSRLCEYANGAGRETDAEWSHAFCADGQATGTSEVGRYLANPFGLYDTIGNVGEWTRDCATLSYVDAPTDGSAREQGLCSSRIVRGGSWFHGAVDLRFSARHRSGTRESNDFTGFRVVRAIEE